MTGHRQLLLQHRGIALAIVLLALLARVLIPTGYMPVYRDGGLVMALCPAQGPMPATHGAMAGMHHVSTAHDPHHDHDESQHGKDGPCAFAGVAFASIAVADPVLLALAILYIVTLLFHTPQRPRVANPRFRLPPRTGPPRAA